MPTSASAATFTFSNFAAKLPPSEADVGISTTLRRQYKDTTFSLTFTDASLKDPTSGQGMVVVAEKPMGEGVRGAVSYDISKRSATGVVALNKPINGSDLTLRATYKQAGDQFILEEAWKFDDSNRLSGVYNFATEEAQFAYTHIRGPWSATGKYNFQKDTTVLEVTKRQGKSLLSASYGLQDNMMVLGWLEKPYKATLKAKVGPGGLSAAQVAFTVVHEFEL